MKRRLAEMFLLNKVVLLRPEHLAPDDELARLVPFLINQPPLENRAMAYICQDYRCLKPVNERSEFKLALEALTAVRAMPKP